MHEADVAQSKFISENRELNSVFLVVFYGNYSVQRGTAVIPLF
jgi:hypothetical protein